MNKALFIVAILALFPWAALATPGTLYQQEGGTNDQDPVEVDGAGHGPTGTDADNWTNWKYQYGSGSYSAVYAGDNGEMVAEQTGDMALDVEADVEMYITQTIANNKIYFHLGNVYSATENDKTAIVEGTLTSNNGQYIGISFAGQGKDASNFEQIGGAYTGKILGGMQSDHDTWRAQNNQMDLLMLMNVDGGPWQVPVNYGDGSHGTIHDTLWWLVNGGAPGTYQTNWLVRLLPTTHQPDGDYYLDPVIVSAPVL